MKVYIVDDERLARTELEYLLRSFPEIDVVGQFSNVDDVLKSLQTSRPDLIFLDIQMPEKNGFDLVEEITDETIQIIFTTAYDQFAIKAFEHHALDYLLKPITEERLHKAIERAKKSILLHQNKQSLSTNKQSIKVKFEEVFIDVPIKDIDLFESFGNYIKIYFQDKVLLHHASLKTIAEGLSDMKFFRANRYTIVPLEGVKSVVKHSKSKLSLEMKNGRTVTCSERKTVALRKLIKEHQISFPII